MKKIKKILLRTIILILSMLGILISINPSNAADAGRIVGGTVGTAAGGAALYAGAPAVAGVVGIGVIFVWAIQLVVLALGLLLHGIMAGLTGLGGNWGDGVHGIRDIFFNHSSLTTAAFFADSSNPLGLTDTAIWSNGSVMFSISQKVTQYYTVMRNIAIAALLFVLLYIAIRMAMSTISADEAKYKRMLTNWAVSLALVFVLHYIMIITFYINNTLVGILEKSLVGSDNTGNLISLVMEGALVPVAGFGEAIMFIMIIGMEFTFMFMYIKRVITLAFLILIAPLITITYSIDKIGDGRSQALNTWLKEFIFNVIIQPFHCILYITMIQTAIEAMAGQENFGAIIIYIIILQFVKEAEEIIKKIFNIQAGSMGGIKDMGGMALGAFMAFGGLAKGGNKNKNKKMPEMKRDTNHPRTTGEAGNASQQGGATSAGGNTQQTRNNSGITPPTPPVIQGNDQGQIQQQAAQQQAAQQQAVQQAAQQQAAQQQAAQQQANQQAAQQQAAQQAAAQDQSRAQRFTNAAAATVKFFGGNVDSAEEMRRSIRNAAIKAGVAVGAAGIGLGMGDATKAASMGMIGYGATDKIGGAIDSYKKNEQLEEYEGIYDDNYETYVNEYKRIKSAELGINPDQISEEEIQSDLVSMFDDYDDGSLDLKKAEKNKELRDLKRDFLKDNYEKLKDSYEATGSEKGADMVKARTRNKSSVKYKAKYPNA